MIYGDQWIHNLKLRISFHQVDGTYYLQEQHSTSDGNIIWDIISSSVCHKNTHNDMSLEYRLDKITAFESSSFHSRDKGGHVFTKGESLS